MVNILLALFPKKEQKDKFLYVITESICKGINDINSMLEELRAQLFFNTLTFWLKDYENLLVLNASGLSVEERRKGVEARWKAKGRKSSLAFLQEILDVFLQDSAIATMKFTNGVYKTTLKVFGELPSLKNLYDELFITRPAHLPLQFSFKFLYESKHKLAAYSTIKRRVMIGKPIEVKI